MATASHAAELELRQIAGGMQGIWVVVRDFERYGLVTTIDFQFAVIPNHRPAFHDGTDCDLDVDRVRILARRRKSIMILSDHQ
jgi:hypothetical protein